MTVEHLATCVAVIGFAAAGFALLVAASPLGQIAAKPFSCRTCLSGWGAIAAAAILRPPGLVPSEAWLMWAVLSLAGVGIAHLVLSLGDSSPAPPPPWPSDESQPRVPSSESRE